MNKKESDDLTNSMLVADCLLRLKSLENLLIAKGVFTKEEFEEEMNGMAKIIAKSILEKAKVQGDIEEMVKSLQGFTKKPPTEN